MNIPILGTGNMGTAFAPQIQAAGHGLNISLGYGAGLGTLIAPTWLRQA